MVLPAAFAGGHALKDLGPLVIGQFRLAAEPRASLAGDSPPFVGPLDDAVAFVFGHGTQQGDEAAT
jgi:hypothetical protein